MLEKNVLIRLCRARDRLRESHEQRLSVRQVARATGMSPYHFIRLFKAVFGETPYQCQLRARLGRAKHLLLLAEDSVTDICLETGFSSLGSFSYLFSRHTGVSPSAYRQRVRPLVQIPGEVPSIFIPGCFSLMIGQPK